jgi:hypothetical protein
MNDTVLTDEDIKRIEASTYADERGYIHAIEAAVIAKLDAKHLAMEEALVRKYTEGERHLIDAALIAAAEIIMEGKFAIKHDKNLSMFNGRPDYKPLQCVLQFNPEKQRTILDRFTFEAEFADQRESEILFTVTRK